MGRQQLHLMTSLNSWAGLWPEPHCLLKISENSPFEHVYQVNLPFDNMQNSKEFFFCQRELKWKLFTCMLYHLLKHNRKPRPVKGPGTYLSKVDCDWPPVFSELGVLGLWGGDGAVLAAALLWWGHSHSQWCPAGRSPIEGWCSWVMALPWAQGLFPTPLLRGLPENPSRPSYRR